MAVHSQQCAFPIGCDLINDLGALPDNEDIIIDYLLERLKRGQIYTWVGPLLLALNPCNVIATSNIYGPSEFNKYISMADVIREKISPHIFAVAAKAHYSLIEKYGRKCQVIVISGETGTGKTFNACKCLEFLSVLNKKSPVLGAGDYMCNIMKKITDANHLISAFTTACTEKNEVSSRHGQLLRLHYNTGTISGATINSFLLERSRVTKGSSNFQIFYQIMFGMPDEELDSLKLSKQEEYDILNIIDSSKKKYFLDGFQDTLNTFEMLGFPVDQKKHVFQVLALLIHLGNIQFVQNGETCNIDFDDGKSNEALKNACTLSSLNAEDITELLTTILINPQSTWRKHTTYHRNLTTVEACRNRLYSIIRHIYDLLFHWILDRSNDALSVKHESSEWLGVLDIFGFESFNVNSIEQLCVNYANEKMQRYFMETYLENNRKHLQEEGFIEITQQLETIESYKERISVLEEGLFLILNDAAQSLIPIDVSAIIQLACSNSHNVQKHYLHERGGNFVIEHYSGPVSYSISDLLSKNSDKVPTEISTTFNKSKNKFLRSLININDRNSPRGIKASTKMRTMLAKLKYSMDSLIKELNKCDLYYVRCVKPSSLGGNNWDRNDFKKQLVCTGIFDTLSIAKCKYPIRLSYDDFCNRYCRRLSDEDYFDRKCRIVLESIATREELQTLIYYGKHAVFLTEPIFFKLEIYRRSYRKKCARKIERFWMNYRKKKVHPISKYTITGRMSKENEQFVRENIIQVTGEQESKKSVDSEEDDDVFININNTQENISSVLRKRNNSKVAEIKEESSLNKNSSSRRESSESKKFKHDLENWQIKFMQNNCHLGSLKNQYVADYLKTITSQTNILESDQLSISDYNKNVTSCVAEVDINCNNNLPTDCCLINRSSTEDNYKLTHIIEYDEEKGFHVVKSRTCTFFYRNRILSRRRLAAVPIRFHTRPTCLINSHMLPRSELPQGLQDCL